MPPRPFRRRPDRAPGSRPTSHGMGVFQNPSASRFRPASGWNSVHLTLDVLKRRPGSGDVAVADRTREVLAYRALDRGQRHRPAERGESPQQGGVRKRPAKLFARDVDRWNRQAPLGAQLRGQLTEAELLEAPPGIDQYVTARPSATSRGRPGGGRLHPGRSRHPGAQMARGNGSDGHRCGRMTSPRPCLRTRTPEAPARGVPRRMPPPRAARPQSPHHVPRDPGCAPETADRGRRAHRRGVWRAAPRASARRPPMPPRSRPKPAKLGARVAE